MKQKQNKYGMDKYNDIDKEISDGYNKIKNAQKDIEGYQARTQQKLDKMNKLSKEI